MSCPDFDIWTKAEKYFISKPPGPIYHTHSLLWADESLYTSMHHGFNQTQRRAFIHMCAQTHEKGREVEWVKTSFTASVGDQQQERNFMQTKKLASPRINKYLQLEQPCDQTHNPLSAQKAEFILISSTAAGGKPGKKEMYRFSFSRQ